MIDKWYYIWYYKEGDVGTFEKDLQKICQNPNNVRLQTLIKVLTNLGFEYRKKKEHVFIHQGHILTVAAHGTNPLLKEIICQKNLRISARERFD